LANVRGVTTWSALGNVTELCDKTRLLQTLDMCLLRANVTPLLAAVNLNGTLAYLFRRRSFFGLFMAHIFLGAWMRVIPFIF
jgi:hypothetical protein